MTAVRAPFLSSVPLSREADAIASIPTSDSFQGAIRPFLRAIDGLNTHDAAYNTSIVRSLSRSRRAL